MGKILSWTSHVLKAGKRLKVLYFTFSDVIIAFICIFLNAEVSKSYQDYQKSGIITVVLVAVR